MGLGTGEECAALLDAAIHKIPVSFCAKAAVFILLPILVSMVIKIIYMRLINGTSRLYIFTHYRDPLYRELMRLADTEKLTDMIDDWCWEYLDAGKEEKVVSEIHTGNRTERENLQQEMDKVEALESRRNKGRFREAVRLLNADPPFKYKSDRQLELYRAFLDRLEKVVKFPEEKRARNYILDSITIVLTAFSVLITMVDVGWTIKLIVLSSAFLIFLVWLFSKFLAGIFSLGTRKEEKILYMYGLLEDVVIFGRPVYHMERIDDYWKAKTYCDRMCVKYGFITLIRALPKLMRGTVEEKSGDE